MLNKPFSISTSLYLDGLRLTSALIVLVAHSFKVLFPTLLLKLSFLPHLAHGAVVIFFVLSGYVISYSTNIKKRTLSQYAIARLSRLYSIMFPAFLITVLCFFLSEIFNPQIFSSFSRGQDFLRSTMTLFFINELWFSSSAPPINGPLWSLGYEFWYYVLFGAFLFKKPGVKGWLVVFLISLIAGPKILLMMVIWILGVIAYRLPRFEMQTKTCWIFVFVFLAIGVTVIITIPELPYAEIKKPLTWASQFLTDYIAGLFIALSVWFLPLSNNSINTSKGIYNFQKKFRTIADMTFPIYVLHFPLLVLTKCILFNLFNEKGLLIFGGGLTFMLCVLLGLFFESKKNWWYQFFTKLLIKLPF